MNTNWVRRSLGCLTAGSLLFSQVPAFAGECQIKQMEVPVTMHGLRPTLAAKINGVDAVFALDSGAFWSVITAAAADQYHLYSDRNKLPGFSVIGINGAAPVKVARVDTFTIFNVPVNKVDLLVGGTEPGAGTVGVLGQNLLRIADIEYDLAQGVVRFHKTTDCKKSVLAYWVKPGEAYSLVDIQTATPLEPHTVAVAYLNGEKIKVTFDTGSPASIIGLRAAAKAGVKPGGPGVSEDQSITGMGHASVQTWIATFPVLKIGDEEVRNARLRFADLGNLDMLLGADFFLSHRVYVANSQSKLYFTYNGGPVFNLEAARAREKSATTVDLADQDAPSIARRAAAYAARRDFEHALEDYNRACDLQPKEASCFYARGMVKRELGHEADGISDIDRALTLNPDYVEAWMVRAHIQLNAGATAEGLKSLGEVDRLAAKQDNLRYQLAVLYAQAGEWRRSIEQSDYWINSHPDDANLPHALNERCFTRAILGQVLYQALVDCNKALSYLPHSAPLLDSRGFVYLRSNEFKKAIADYDAALKVDPKQAWSLYCRGLAKTHLGHSQEGAADISAAVAVDPNLPKRAEQYGLK